MMKQDFIPLYSEAPKELYLVVESPYHCATVETSLEAAVQKAKSTLMDYVKDKSEFERGETRFVSIPDPDIDGTEKWFLERLVEGENDEGEMVSDWMDYEWHYELDPPEVYIQRIY